MAAVSDVLNPIEVHKAGMPTPNRGLGYEGARAFIRQFEGGGN
jgi:hypothetical protein